MKRVIILGGGVSGLSAAHELIERGFEVHVYERRTIPGGKARSIPVAGTGNGGHMDLPGEHGFRFFPGFYRHITDTMKRIPYNHKQSVFDQIVPSTQMGIAREEQDLRVYQLGKKGFIQNFKKNLRTFFDSDWSLKEQELEMMVERIWQILTSCRARILDEYERMSWWEFVGAQGQSEAFQKMAAVITRSLVAAKAKEASAKTIGTVLTQLMLDWLSPTQNIDRVLNGPTNERWIKPWVKYLQNRGVNYVLGAEVIEQGIEKEKLAKAVIEMNGVKKNIKGDYFIAALPIEVMGGLISADMLKADPALEGIKRLVNSVDWMNGIQFYLKRDLPFVHGHILLMDSPWALTGISQKQFWNDVNLGRYGDGAVKGILSIDISEWNVEGNLIRKKASDCSKKEIMQEVWYQLKRSLRLGEARLLDSDLHSWFLDPDISIHNGKMHNAEPLLINKCNTWNLRPNAYTGISNLFLAGDYVRTSTDLATMEGANEAARRAVNAILDAANSHKKKCKLWTMYEFDLFLPWKLHDLERFKQGLPWSDDIPVNKRLRFFVSWFIKSTLFRN